MDFEQLKIFIAVVEQGSFTKAAETLYISHSTTSRNVAALEGNLNVRLLIRDSRGLKLTEAGNLLYREGQVLLQKAQELEAAVQNAGSGVVGGLSVASVKLYSRELNDAYGQFVSSYPNVVLGIYHHELSEVFGLVSRGEEDLGITFSYSLPKELEDFEVRKVAQEKYCVVVSQAHQLASKKTVRASELREANYVSVGVQRSDFTRRLEEEILKDRPKSEILSVPTLESLFLQVRSGNGISLVPYPMAREYGENCAVLEVEDVDTRFDVVAFWRKDNENPSLPLFTKLIEKEHV